MHLEGSGLGFRVDWISLGCGLGALGRARGAWDLQEMLELPLPGPEASPDLKPEAHTHTHTHTPQRDKHKDLHNWDWNKHAKEIP